MHRRIFTHIRGLCKSSQICNSVINTRPPDILLALILFFATASSGYAQELDVNVQVNRSRISGASLDYLDDFDEKLESYLNGMNWTHDNLRRYEKIEADIQIYLTRVSDNYTFTADLIIRSSRPIYNTTRETTLFLYNDDSWTFQYIPNSTLVHDELQFDDISTLLNFYAYIILGYDYDSFEALGGSSYFAEAQDQLSIALNSSSPGWQRSSGQPNNRAQLIADLSNPNYEPLRKAIYQYHRLGLDLFIKNPQKARQNILEALQLIQQAKRQTVNNLLFDIFFNAKYLELVSVFKGAPADVRSQAFNLLSEIDISHLNAYRELQ